MKILSVTFENLNSLRGKHSIRFDVPPLEGCGLFAITGATGAGKTTILDAITVALYGKTSRYENDVPKDLMSRHTGECFADVEFEVKGKNYRSSWSLHRSRKKHDGVFQSSKMEVWNLSDNEMLSDKPSSVPQLIEELTGLNKERFLRSVMLAQGDFAAFLKAKEGEKSALLEQMTDTKIYSDLSKLCFDITKEENLKLETLKSQNSYLQLLPEEEKSAIKAQKTELQIESDSLTKELNLLRNELQLLVDRENNTKQKNELTQKLDELTLHIEEFAPQKSRLELHKKAQPFQSDFKTLEENEKRILKLTVEITQFEKKLPETTTKKKDVEQELQKNETTLKSLHEENQTKEELFQKVEQLDAKIEAETSVYKRDSDAMQKLQTEFDILTQKLKNTIAEIEKKYTALPDFIIRTHIDRLLDSNLEEKETTLIQLRNGVTRWKNAASFAKQFKKDTDSHVSLTNELIELEQRIEKGNNLLVVEIQKFTECEVKLPLLEKAVEREKLIAKYEHDRTTLQENEPCPLCGSVHHPYISEYHSRQRTEAENEFSMEKENLKKCTNTITEYKTLLAQFEQDKRNKQSRIKELALSLESLKKEFDTLGILDCEITNADEIQNNAEVKEQEFTIAETELQYAHSLKSLNQTKKNLEENCMVLTEKLEQKKEEFTKQREMYRQLQQDRGTLFGNSIVKDERNMLRKRINEATSVQESARKKLETVIAEFQMVSINLERSTKELSLLKNENLQLQKDFFNLINKQGFTAKSDIQSALLDSIEVNSIETRLKELDASKNQLQGVINDIVKKLDESSLLHQYSRNKEELTTIISEKENTQKSHEKTIGTLEAQLKHDNELIQQSKELIEKIKLQEIEYRKWNSLNDIIGKGDGTKFSKFAQGLTLARLIQLANNHLKKLNERYRISHKNDDEHPLELEIIDTHQADSKRPVESLSGGETFLVSLGLALGLSELASRRVKIDSLFIDEGFGTLDSDTLDTAISTLETLHSSGKTIGIISHVEALKERITTQIQVSKIGAGQSKITIVP